VFYTVVLNDTFRINYYKSYLFHVEKAIADGVHVQGYFAWSLLDNFEWVNGYDMRFGLTYVNFSTFERIPKSSAKWYGSFVRKNPHFGTKTIDLDRYQFSAHFLVVVSCMCFTVFLVMFFLCANVCRQKDDILISIRHSAATNSYFQVDQTEL
jgi:hypothetical protein